MATALVYVVSGLLLLLAGGEALLRGAVALALRARITPTVVGLTVVAAGTSVPELAVSVLASIRNQPDITVGNVVGSNIFNLTVIIGLTAFVHPLKIQGDTIKLELPVLVLVTLMYIAVAQDAAINRIDAILFLAVYVGFTVYLISIVRKKVGAAEESKIAEEVDELAEEAPPDQSLTWTLALVAGGCALLAAGAHLAVVGAVDLGKMFGLSEAVIGLTIVACGTSLPEVVTSLVSTYRGRDDVAVANCIGSNLFNILGILGISGLVIPLRVPQSMLTSDHWWLLGITLGIVPILMTGRKVSRLEGLALFSVYLVYLSLLLSQVGQ